MQNVQLRGLMAAYKANRRSENEQARELIHLRQRSYRGVPTPQYGWVNQGAPRGEFCYRGVKYTR